MEDFLKAAVTIRLHGIAEVSRVLQGMGCSGIIDKLKEEAQEKSRTWGYAVANQLNLKMLAPELLEAKRSEYATSTLISRWFTQMTPEVAGSDPALIFNFDETMLHAVSRTKVIVTGDKKCFRRKSPSGPHVTLGLCFSPLGVHPPPLIILPVANPVHEFHYFQSINVTQITNSSSGWMTYEIFLQWAEYFCNWLNSYRQTLPEGLRERTAILFIDNCRTHCLLGALTLLARNNVKVISFPSHVTHILQPIDVTSMTWHVPGHSRAPCLRTCGISESILIGSCP
jgi:hypothetical protein